VAFISNKLSNASVTADLLSSSSANVSTVLTIEFSSPFPIPPTCSFELALPDGITLMPGASSQDLQISNVSYYNQSGVLILTETLPTKFEARSIMVNRSTRNPTAQLEDSGSLTVERNAEPQIPSGAVVKYTAGPFQRRESSGSTGVFKLYVRKADGFDSAIVAGHVLRYPPPTITAVWPQNSRIPGAVSMTVFGRHYGPVPGDLSISSSHPKHQRIMMGGLDCATVAWTSDSTIVCLSPSAGTYLRIRGTTIRSSSYKSTFLSQAQSFMSTTSNVPEDEIEQHRFKPESIGGYYRGSDCNIFLRHIV